MSDAYKYTVTLNTKNKALAEYFNACVAQKTTQLEPNADICGESLDRIQKIFEVSREAEAISELGQANPRLMPREEEDGQRTYTFQLHFNSLTGAQAEQLGALTGAQEEGSLLEVVLVKSLSQWGDKDSVQYVAGQEIKTKSDLKFDGE